MFDINQTRNDFPILGRRVYDRPLVYLDNAATTQKPRQVVEAITEEYYNVNANVHRGVHYLSQQATELHEGARETVRRFINARSTSEIIFTRGTTESLNLVASSFCDEFMQAGDEVIVSVMEHHSNIVPWQLLQRNCRVVLRVVPMNADGSLMLDAYEDLFTDNTRLVALAHVSNVLGTVNPVKEMIAIAHRHGVPVLVDGAQAVAHRRVDVVDLDADFYAFSAHKMYGPVGVGILYGKRRFLEALPPYQGGGEMIGHVSFEKTTFADLPFKFEAGTPDYVGMAAMTAAIDYITSLGLDNIAAHEQELLAAATAGLMEIPGMKIFGNAPGKEGVISFLVDGIHHYDMGMLLDKMGVAVRTGHHCAQPLMTTLGIEGTVRASFAAYNSIDEVNRFVAAVARAVAMFRK